MRTCSTVTIRQRVTGTADGGLADARTGLAMETFYVDARGRAYGVPQQRLLAASVADLDYALAGMQPLPSLQVPAIMHACNLFTNVSVAPTLFVGFG